MASNTSSQQIQEGDQTNRIRCPFHTYGCKELILRTKLMDHMLSETHFRVITSLIHLQKSNYESAQIEVSTNPSDEDAPPSAANTELQRIAQFFEQFFSLLVNIVQPLNPEGSAFNTNLSLSYSIGREQIQEMDRDLNHNLNLQLHRNQYQSNEAMLEYLSNKFERSSTDEYSTNPSRDAEHILRSNSLLQIQLDETSVTTDGDLIWHINDISKKIDDAISRKQPCIYSSVFKKNMNGHSLRACIYLNGDKDHKSISFKVHLNPPVQSAFRGRIKFILVDQSNSSEPRHIIKCCTGEMNNVNDSLGFDNFADKNELQKYQSPFICNGSVYALVRVDQTNQEKYANLPPSVQDAFAKSETI